MADQNLLVTEQEVKDALGIGSFREMSKDKVIEFCSLIPTMDKDVAKEVLAQFPTFVDFGKTIVENLRINCDKALEANDKSQAESINTYIRVLDIIERNLEKDSMSEAERMFCIDKMVEIADKVAAKDTENKEFIKEIVKYGRDALLIALIATGALLGVKATGKLPRIKR